MCVGAIIHSRVGEVVYGAAEPKTGAAGSVFDLLSSTAHNHQVAVRGGILAGECAELLRTFFQKRRYKQD
jgi:tRNA(adenine34) deaminase